MFQILVGIAGGDHTTTASMAEILGQMPDVLLPTAEFFAKGYMPDVWVHVDAGADENIALSPTSKTPVISLGDDVLLPCRASTLLAAIHSAVLPADELTYGAVTLNPYTRACVVDGSEKDLTDIEAGLLARLLKAQGASVPRDVLLAGVWGFRPDLETHTLETHIYRLRQKIEPDPAQPVYVLTESESYRSA